MSFSGFPSFNSRLNELTVYEKGWGTPRSFSPTDPDVEFSAEESDEELSQGRPNTPSISLSHNEEQKESEGLAHPVESGGLEDLVARLSELPSLTPINSSTCSSASVSTPFGITRVSSFPNLSVRAISAAAGNLPEHERQRGAGGSVLAARATTPPLLRTITARISTAANQLVIPQPVRAATCTNLSINLQATVVALSNTVSNPPPVVALSNTVSNPPSLPNHSKKRGRQEYDWGMVAQAQDDSVREHPADSAASKRKRGGE